MIGVVAGTGFAISSDSEQWRQARTRRAQRGPRSRSRSSLGEAHLHLLLLSQQGYVGCGLGVAGKISCPSVDTARHSPHGRVGAAARFKGACRAIGLGGPQLHERPNTVIFGQIALKERDNEEIIALQGRTTTCSTRVDQPPSNALHRDRRRSAGASRPGTFRRAGSTAKCRSRRASGSPGR